MYCNTIQHATTPTPVTLIMIQASTLPGLSHAIALTGNRLNSWVDDRHKYECTVQKSHKEIQKSHKEICTAEWRAEWRTFPSGP